MKKLSQTCALIALFSLPFAKVSGQTYPPGTNSCGVPNNPTTESDPPCTTDSSNDSDSSSGGDSSGSSNGGGGGGGSPAPQYPTGPKVDSPATGGVIHNLDVPQAVAQPNSGGARLRTRDVRLPNSTSDLPLSLTRYYQSRDVTPNADLMGHGRTWTHTYSWRMWASGTGGSSRSIVFPQGTVLDFAPYPGTIDFEGQTSVKYIPQAGRGERLYQVGNFYHLLIPGGVRYSFERVTDTDGTVRYVPRSERDSKGNFHNYITDAQSRITRVDDAAGNWIKMTYSQIQINRKVNVPIHTISAAPVVGWNEVTVTTTQPFRWLQGISAPGNWFRMAEIEFYKPVTGGGTTKLSGTVYGTGPASYGSSTYDKAFDNKTNTEFAFARPSGGVAGIDLGSGNASNLAKIRYFISSWSSGYLSSYIGHQFVGCVESPEIITVLTGVTTSSSQKVNYLYDTHTDTSIDQDHLVLSGIDYFTDQNGDGTDDDADDATITWVTAQQGASPSALRVREPRSSTSTPDLSFNYFPVNLSVKGQPYLIQDGASGSTIFSSEPKNTHKFVAADGGNHTIVNTGSYAYLPSSTTDAAGKVTNYTWSSANFLASKTTPAGTTTYTWNYMGQPLTATTPDGLTETSTYDVQGRLLTKSYSATGQVTRKTTYTRDGVGRVTRITYPDASYEQFTYNGVGLVTLIREKNGSYTTFTYDSTGLRTSVTRGLATATATSGGETSTFVWFAAGDPSGSPARTLKSETDPRGRTTSYTYDFAGRVTNTTYADASVRSLAYDGYGNKIVESDGFAVQYWTYDNFRRVLTHTDGMNGVTSYDYGLNGSACSCYGAGAPTLITTPAGRKTRRYYDLKSRLIQETRGFATADAATTTYVRDVLGRVVTTIDPDGYTTTATYDSMGKTLSTTVDSAGLNLTTSHVYNPFGNQTSMTLPGGRTASMTYDSMDRMLTLTDPLGTVMVRIYDLGGRRTSETRASGSALARTTSYAYNLFDRVVTITHPDSTTASRTYQPGGDLASMTDELGHTTSISESLATWSDSVGTSWSTFVTTTTDATGQASSSHSRPLAQKGGTVKTVSAAGRITESYYDGNGNMVQKRDGLVTSGSGLAADLTLTALSYDADSLLASTTVDPSGLNQTTVFTRDSRGNVATRTDPLGCVTISTWDKRGNLIKTKLPDNREDLASYDALGRKTSATDPKNQTIAYTYWNDSGSEATLTDSKNQTTTWTYNLRGQLLTKTYPNGDDHAYSYDAMGRMATHITPKNEICTYSYDLRDRPILSDWNSTTPDTARAYWADGLLKSIDNGVSKSDYAYNARHDLTSETQTLAGRPARTVSYSYDADGLRGGTTYPSAKTVALAWTSRFQLQSVSTDGPPPLAIYTYDKAGRNTAIAHENGIIESKSYNAAGELISNFHLLGSTAVDGHTYTLDATGRRTAETFSDGTTPARTYGYDAASQVTSADYGSSLTDAYAYDAMGNRTTSSVASLGGTTANYTTNNANQYTTITGLTPISHDANGNLLQQNNVTYTWDSENRLLSVTPNTPALGDKSLVDTYDGHHRRVTRTIREWTTSAWQNTETMQFVYDGWNVVEEYALNPVNSVLARTLTWGQDLGGGQSLQAAGGVGGLLLVEEISGATTTAYHFHYDGNGNVTQITDLSGATAASYRYDAFGNTLSTTGSYSSQNRYRFSTKPLDVEVTNAPLYYYGYRYYDPVTGRWPSRDPIGERGGMNLYGFVKNNGLNRIDLLGQAELAVSASCSGHEDLLKNMTYFAEEEPHEKGQPEPPKNFRALPPPGQQVAANAIYLGDGTATKVRDSSSVEVVCICENNIWRAEVTIKDAAWPWPKSKKWKRGEPAPPAWPADPNNPNNYPYDGSPPPPVQPPLDPEVPPDLPPVPG